MEKIISLSSTKEFIPVPGAFTLAAETLGVTPQAVSQAWRRGKQERVMIEVIKASIDILERRKQERIQYADMLRKAAQLTGEANQAADAAINEAI